MKKLLISLLILAMLLPCAALAGTMEDFAEPDTIYSPGVRWELPLCNTTDE